MDKLLKDMSVSSVLISVIGVVLLIMPNLTNRLIVFGIGTVLVVYGIFRVFRYVRREASAAMFDHDLSAGLISAVSGLFMLVYSNVVIGILPFILGLFLIFGGALTIQTAFDVRRFHGTRWNLHLIAGLLFVFFGMTAIRNPFGTAGAMTRFAGACMLVLGIYMFTANRKVNDLRRRFMSDTDIIDEEDIK